MKKNYSMRIASMLLVLVLLTTCVISGTFAKYVTTGSANDVARVAKWGFNDPAVIEFDMFDADYTDVKAANGTDNLVAPGTTKTATINLLYDGQAAPEVDYNLTVSLDITGTSELLDLLKWSYTYGSTTENDLSYAELETKIAALSADYEANVLPAASIQITWEWPFLDTDEANAADTALGNASTTELSVVFTFTATQLND